jgi:hypothetical protein
MAKASSLKHVPLNSFADAEGIPFTLNSHTAAGYLSLKYPAWVIEGTSPIGVSQLSPREFLEDLYSEITREPANFRTKSATWHSQLAEALIKLSTDAELMPLIQDIPLIPLHDGSWTSSKGQSLFFSKSETSLEIPSGIEVLIVDSTADTDPNRRKLFTTLGVKAWEAHEICRLVLKVHESSDFDPQSLTVDQLISHAAFLYKASWQPPKAADLWFATVQDERCMGRKLYIPGSAETNSPAARIFAQLQKKFAVIHNDYLKAFPLDADWPIWLVNNLGLSKVPRLITPHVEPQPQPTQTLTINRSPKTNEGFFSEDLFDIPSDQALPNKNSTSNQGKTTVVGSLDVLQDFDFDSFLHQDDLAGTPGGATTPPQQLSRTTTFQTPQDDQMPLTLSEQQNKQETWAARRLKAQQHMAQPGRKPRSTSVEGNGGNHRLQDYQMQLMLLEQQNKKRLMIARLEQDQFGLPQAQQAQLSQQHQQVGCKLSCVVSAGLKFFVGGLSFVLF